MKKILNGVFVFILIIITLYFINRQLDLSMMVSTIKSAKLHFLVIALLCMFLFWYIESVLISKLLKKISKKKDTMWLSIKTTLIGQYYSLITPFASGGQPAQLYALKKENVSIGNGTAVLVAKFLLFQISVTLYSLLLWLFRFKYLSANLSLAKSFIFIGLFINSIGLTAIVLVAFRPNKLKKIIFCILSLIYKFKIIKNIDSKYKSLDRILNDYKKGIKYLKNDIFYTSKMFFYSFIQLTVFFSITYFIYKSLGLSGVSVIDIITMQALLYMAVSFIPIPGTIGASEVGFSMIFISAFSSNLVPVALLMWRGISYYFGLIFCGLFTLYIYLKNNVFDSLKYN